MSKTCVLLFQANVKRTELEKASASLAQYEHMLKEYEEYLETAQNKLKADTISAHDLSHLQNQLAAHVVWSYTFTSMFSHLSFQIKSRHQISFWVLAYFLIMVLFSISVNPGILH